MSTKHDQSGFGHIVLPLMIVALLVIGFSGYKVWRKQHSTSNNTNNVAATVSIPTQIKTKADLRQAAQALNDADKQMQSQLNSSALNGSINKLL